MLLTQIVALLLRIDLVQLHTQSFVLQFLDRYIDEQIREVINDL